MNEISFSITKSLLKFSPEIELTRCEFIIVRICSCLRPNPRLYCRPNPLSYCHLQYTNGIDADKIYLPYKARFEALENSLPLFDNVVHFSGFTECHGCSNHILDKHMVSTFRRRSALVIGKAARNNRARGKFNTVRCGQSHARSWSVAPSILNFNPSSRDGRSYSCEYVLDQNCFDY